MKGLIKAVQQPFRHKYFLLMWRQKNLHVSDIIYYTVHAFYHSLLNDHIV